MLNSVMQKKHDEDDVEEGGGLFQYKEEDDSFYDTEDIDDAEVIYRRADEAVYTISDYFDDEAGLFTVSKTFGDATLSYSIYRKRVQLIAPRWK